MNKKERFSVSNEKKYSLRGIQKEHDSMSQTRKIDTYWR
jgi:hypothetical protein